MNLTIITPTLPFPLNSGGAQAQFNMINALRNKYNITIIFIQTRLNQSTPIKELSKKWPNVTISTYTYMRQILHWPFLKNKIARAIKIKLFANNNKFEIERAIEPYGIYFTKDLVKFVNTTIKDKNTDIIQVEFFPCLHLAQYLPDNIRKIFIHHEIRFIRNNRLLSGMELTKSESLKLDKVKRQEINDLNLFDRVVTLTDTDKNILLSNNVKADIIVSPAAVNTTVKSYIGWNNRILFLGGYSHKPNVEGLEWFIYHVMPLLSHNNESKFELHLVGSGWPESLVQKYKKDVHTEFVYHGFVDDISSVVCGSIMIVPILTGSGMRMKILESSALGVPFITTPTGVEGLDFIDGQDCIIKNTPTEWKDALLELMRNDTLRQSITSGAKNVFEKNYSIPTLIKRREHVYNF